MLETKDYIMGVLMVGGITGIFAAGFALFILHLQDVKQKFKVIAWICLGVFVICTITGFAMARSGGSVGGGDRDNPYEQYYDKEWAQDIGDAYDGDGYYRGAPQ